MGIRKTIFFVALLATTINLHGQSFLQEYEEAKRLYSTGQFQAAASAFSELSSIKSTAEYASYFFALSQYKLENDQEAIAMCKQIIDKSPGWEKLSEVAFLGAFISLKQKKYRDVFFFDEYLKPESSFSEQINAELKRSLEAETVETLNSVLSENSDKQLVAISLAKKLGEQSSINQEQIDSLSDIYNLKWKDFYDNSITNIKKDKYNIALVLPFMFEGLEKPEYVIRNRLVMDFYQGFQYSLEEQGIENIEVYLFDTKKSGNTTNSFLEELSAMDLVVGPLYPEPVSIVSEFCKSNRINMINPLTENNDYMEGNPFAFLFKPSYLTQAEKAASWVVDNVENKNAVIFFEENERDSAFAETYKSILENNDFEILEISSVNEEESKLILDRYLEQYEKYYTKEEADSLIELEMKNRFIKTRKLRSFEEKDTVLSAIYFYDKEDENREDKLIAYEDRFVIEKDSIGSILVATRANAIANNMISLVASRNDSVILIGKEDWLNFKTLNYEQVDNHNVKFISSFFVDKTSNKYSSFVENFRIQNDIFPSEYHISGFEISCFISKLLGQYGKYFQLELPENALIDGILTPGINYNNKNDNQVVPILEVDNFEVKSINKPYYADRK